MSAARALDSISLEVAELNGLGIDALRAQWICRWTSPAPPIQSADVLRRLLAWKIQTAAFGDIDAETLGSMKHACTAIAAGRSPVNDRPSLRAGAILVREWRGITHRVLVLETGFEHESKRYRSLSEVARAISGTRWSGPRFFGLEEEKTKKDRRNGAEENAP